MPESAPVPAPLVQIAPPFSSARLPVIVESASSKVEAFTPPTALRSPPPQPAVFSATAERSPTESVDDAQTPPPWPPPHLVLAPRPALLPLTVEWSSVSSPPAL